MEALATGESARGVTELATALSLTKSNVHRLLQTLVTLGYARQDRDSGRYEPTLRFWEIGYRVISRFEVRSFARPHMEKLAAVSKETVHLAVLDNEEIVHIDRIDTEHPVRAHLRIGTRSPVYGVALGKAILAHQSDAFIASVSKKLRRFTDATIVKESDLRRELARIRKDGYAINRGEWRAGISGIAAPIQSPFGCPVAAIGVSGPSERLRLEDLKKLASHVKSAAKAIATGQEFVGLGADKLLKQHCR